MSEQTVTIGFKVDRDLVAKADEAARKEGLSRADIARRALLRDLAGMFSPPPAQPQDRAA